MRLKYYVQIPLANAFRRSHRSGDFARVVRVVANERRAVIRAYLFKPTLDRRKRRYARGDLLFVKPERTHCRKRRQRIIHVAPAYGV